MVDETGVGVADPELVIEFQQLSQVMWIWIEFTMEKDRRRDRDVPSSSHNCLVSQCVVEWLHEVGTSYLHWDGQFRRPSEVPRRYLAVVRSFRMYRPPGYEFGIVHAGRRCDNLLVWVYEESKASRGSVDMEKV